MKIKEGDRLILVKHDQNSKRQLWEIGDIAIARQSFELGIDTQISVMRERDSYKNSYFSWCFQHNDFIVLVNKKKAFLKIDQNF